MQKYQKPRFFLVSIVKLHWILSRSEHKSSEHRLTISIQSFKLDSGTHNTWFDRCINKIGCFYLTNPLSFLILVCKRRHLFKCNCVYSEKRTLCLAGLLIIFSVLFQHNFNTRATFTSNPQEEQKNTDLFSFTDKSSFV